MGQTISGAASWRQGIIMGMGVKACTGYPVMVVVVVVMIVGATVVAAKEIFAREVRENILCVACIIAHRNNEMNNLIAKYF
jgi:hypothetical protein